MFIPIAALSLLAACQLKQSDEATLVPPTQAEAEKIVAATEKSYGSGNAAEIMAHYADGAVMFDQGLLAPVADRQLQTKLTQGFAATRPGDFTVANRAIQVLDADTFVASGVTAFTIQLGEARQPVRARFSQVYQRQADGGWKIVHEHMSAPPAGSPLQ
ncbi:MAG: nuclear transport factor 2 family protein [Sphingomicrobium sp.]